MFQKILGCVLLSIGLIYGAVLVRSCVKDKEGVVSAKGKFRFLAPLEFVVFVIASLGVSDYLLNTLATSHFRLTRDEELPGTLICSGVVPGSIFASVGMMAVTGFYSAYSSASANYDLLYGSFSNFVALMFWFYLLAWVQFLGVILNKVWWESRLLQEGDELADADVVPPLLRKAVRKVGRSWRKRK